MRRKSYRWLAMLLIAALFATGVPVQTLQAAKAKIRLNRTKATVFVGKTVQLKMKGTKRKVKWKSSKKAIARVSKKGVVKGRKKGTVKIYAQIGKKRYTCKVTVKQKKGNSAIKNQNKVSVKTSPDASVSQGADNSPVSDGKSSSEPTKTPTICPTEPIETPDVTPDISPTPGTTSTPVKYGTIPDPVFSQKSGVYEDAFNLILSAQEGTTIYYTTDGSIPDPNPGTETGEKQPLSIEVSEANVALLDGSTIETVSDGLKITFSEKDKSASFRLPEDIANYNVYGTVQIDCTTVESSTTGDNPGGGFPGGWGGRNEQSLKMAGIVKDATHPYQDENGKSTRKFELTKSLTANKRQTVSFDISSQSKANLGFLMIGSNSTSLTELTIHSITFVPSDSASKVFSTEPVKYMQPISVKDRTGDANVLASTKNVSLMYNGKEATAYYPSNNQVAKATVIRALAIDEEGNRSNIVTSTYFVGNDIYKTYKNASIMSMVVSPDDLLSAETGIYRVGNYENSGKEWEREADVIYFDEDGTIPFDTKMGIRIHGGYTRHWGQKSFNLYFREEYGMKNLKDYELIPGAMNFEKTEKTTKYKNFMLRNGGNDAEYTKMRDVFIQSLVEDRKFTTQSCRPCVLFLNGEYWGVYNLTEKYGDNYLEEEFGVDKDNVVVVKSIGEGEMELDEGEQEGDYELYRKGLLAFAEKDMSKEEVYREFCEVVDIQNLIDYFAVETYIGNKDWPDNNVQMWRVRTPDGSSYGDGKWRYMLYDTEFSMNLWGCDSTIGNPFTWTAERDSLFAAVMKNSTFQKEFIRTFMDLYNVNFEDTSTKERLDQMAEIYFPLMNQYYARFGLLGSNAYTSEDDARSRFNAQISDINSFLSERRTNILQYLQSSFSLQTPSTVTVKGISGANMKINTTDVELKDGSWNGKYYKEAPITITAPDIDGYSFIRWNISGGTSVSQTTQSTDVTLTGSSVVIEAVYSEN